MSYYSFADSCRVAYIISHVEKADEVLKQQALAAIYALEDGERLQGMSDVNQARQHKSS